MNEVIERQARLQREADNVVQRLGLDALLRRIGEPVRVGSSALGLMVRRDIDVTVISPRLDAALLAAFAGIGAELMGRQELVEAVRFRNDSGSWNREPERYPDGLYLGVSLRIGDANWTMDIWAVDQPERQPDLAHLRTLPPLLTAERRLDILTIKGALAARPPPAIPSADVYEAVLEHGVRGTDAFDRWREARR